MTRAAFVHVRPADWPMLLDIAEAWLSDCEAVLLGWVEEAEDDGEHQSDWRLLREKPAAARGALPATFSGWLRGATTS